LISGPDSLELQVILEVAASVSTTEDIRIHRVNDLRAVPARRHPLQLLVAAMCVLSGVPVLFGGPRPGSVSATLPGPLVLVWAAVLVLGGLAVVVAAVLPSPVTALYYELAAEPPLAVMCGVYAGCALVFGGLNALVPAAIVLGAGIALAKEAGVQCGK
jgi:hypothetical protein